MATQAADTFLARIRTLAQSDILPQAVDVDRTGQFPSSAIAKLGAEGALGLLVDTEHGGLGGGLSELVECCEAIGGACASTGMVFLMHSVTAATVKSGGGARASALLMSMASGDVLGTLAFSERGTGAHFYAPELRAEPDGELRRVTGRKSFVTAGGHADVMLILVQSDGEGLDCYAIDGVDSGVAFDGVWNGLGMRGNSSIALDLTDIAVGPDSRVGEAGLAGDLVFGVVAPHFLAGLAAVNVGIAQAAVSATIEHATSRHYPDGQSLADLPTIQHKLADMDIAVRSARTLLHEATVLAQAEETAALVALMEAKVAATDVASQVTQEALEVCGGQGYTTGLPIERHLRDARAGAVMAPTNGVLRGWIGKALAGLPVP